MRTPTTLSYCTGMPRAVVAPKHAFLARQTAGLGPPRHLARASRAEATSLKDSAGKPTTDMPIGPEVAAECTDHPEFLWERPQGR